MSASGYPSFNKCGHKNPKRCFLKILFNSVGLRNLFEQIAVNKKQRNRHDKEKRGKSPEGYCNARTVRNSHIVQGSRFQNNLFQTAGHGKRYRYGEKRQARSRTRKVIVFEGTVPPFIAEQQNQNYYCGKHAEPGDNKWENTFQSRQIAG